MQTEQPDQVNNIDSLVTAAPNSDIDAGNQVPAPGDVLQAERLRQNLTEKYVSDQLHITMHYVRAIESNRFDKLPGAVFAKGYIKSYALLLGLDPGEVTALFDGIHSEQQGMQEEAVRRHMEQRRSDRNKPWMYASAASFVLGFGGLWALNVITDDNSGAQLAPATATPATITSRPIAQTPPPVQLAPALQPPPDAENTIALQQVGQQQIARPQIEQPPSQQPPSQQPPIESQTIQQQTRQQSQQQSLQQQIQQTPGTPPLTGRAIPEAAAGGPTLATALSALVAERAAIAAEPAAPAQGIPAPAQDPVEDHLFTAGTAGDDVLRIDFTGESWVEVNDSQSGQIYRDIREAGDVLEITGDAPFNILLGDAPFARMFLNGSEIDVTDDIRIDNSARLTVGL